MAARLAGGAEVERIRPFALGVARLVLHEEYRRIAAQPAPLVDREPPAPEAQAGDDARARCLDRCLASLPPADRELVLQYYAHDHRARIEGRAAIARVDQCVASLGAVSSVSTTIASTTSSPI